MFKKLPNSLIILSTLCTVNSYAQATNTVLKTSSNSFGKANKLSTKLKTDNKNENDKKGLRSEFELTSNQLVDDVGEQVGNSMA